MKYKAVWKVVGALCVVGLVIIIIGFAVGGGLFAVLGLWIALVGAGLIGGAVGGVVGGWPVGGDLGGVVGGALIGAVGGMVGGWGVGFLGRWFLGVVVGWPVEWAVSGEVGPVGGMVVGVVVGAVIGHWIDKKKQDIDSEIENTQASLKGCRERIEALSDAGVDMEEWKARLENAEGSFREGELERCSEKINIIERELDEIENTQDSMKDCRERIEALSDVGVDIEDWEARLEDVDELFRKGELERCSEKINIIERKIDEIESTVQPRLKTKFIQTEKLDPDVWTIIPLEVTNCGDMDAEDIELDIGGEVKVHGIERIDRLEAGSSTELEARVQASGKGHVPVEVKTEYKGALQGEKYEDTLRPDLIVGEDISTEKEEEVVIYDDEEDIRERLDSLTDEEKLLDVREVENALEKEEVDKAGQLLADLEKKYKKYKDTIEQLKALDDKKSRLAEQIADGEIDRKTFKDARQDIEEKKHDLEEKLERLRKEVIHEDYEKPF